MSNFSEMLLDVLREKGKTVEDLECDNIIPVRTFYQYKTFTPYLSTVIKIANYLCVSIDYLSGRKTDNNFKPYRAEQSNFFVNLSKLLKLYNISQTKLANDLKIGRSNFSYWKSGIVPKLNTIIDISNYLNCDVDDLLDRQ